jgi:uncharacterized protein with HEPN domain
MLADIKNDLLYLLNILEYAGKIEKYIHDIDTPEKLYEVNDQLNFNATINLLANIGENISKINDATKNEYKDIEWQQIKNFRNRIIHDYMGIDIIITFDIIKNDLPVLKSKIENIIKEKLRQKIFDEEEYEVSKNSKYYKNVEYKNIK